jgi:tRNA (guanine37-N1)-methyltransferase
VITLFPEMVGTVLNHSILGRAKKSGLLDVRVYPLRDFAHDKHHVTDDIPYGGGPGMVLKAEPIFLALEEVRRQRAAVRVLLLSPQGRVFDQVMAKEFSEESRSLVFICGHYEGVDARVNEGTVLEEVSIGDYILTGGELAALAMIDAATRLIPGVLGDPKSVEEESFTSHLLEYPHYTRPAVLKGMAVPEVLISGNHQAIRTWRRGQAILNTLRKRPDLFEQLILSDAERNWLEQAPDREFHNRRNDEPDRAY